MLIGILKCKLYPISSISRESETLSAPINFLPLRGWTGFMYSSIHKILVTLEEIRDLIYRITLLPLSVILVSRNPMS